MELELKSAGITYKVLVDIEDDCVYNVLSVSVYDGQKYHPIHFSFAQRREFYEFYEEALNELYQEEMESLREYYRENDD